MNEERRKKLQQALEKLNDACAVVEEISGEEEEAFENLPEGLQKGEKGESLEAAKGYLDDAVTEIENAAANIQSAIEQ